MIAGQMNHQNSNVTLSFSEPVQANAVRSPVTTPYKFSAKDMENPMLK
jgi:hypothetical protein